MQLTQQRTLPVPQAAAWAALNDIDLLRQAMPGCESITPLGDDRYEVLFNAAVGPVKAKFKGTLALAELDPPNAYTLRFEGQGGGAGHGKGHARVRLEPAGGHTVLHYDVQASVGGRIAQLGSRLVDLAAQKMANDFFAAFGDALAARQPAAAAPAPAAPSPGWLARLLERWRRLWRQA